MKKKIFKEFLLNTFLVYLSLYLPLLLTSFLLNFLDFNSYQAKNLRKRIIEEDIPQKIDAIKNGYIPTYNPDQIIRSDHKINFYPIGSLPQKSSYLCNEGYGLILFQTDRLGLRNKDKNWNNIFQKDNIFIVGDSFANGACVSEEFTLQHILKERTTINTLNLASSSSGPYEYLAVLKLLLKPIIRKSKNENKIILIFFNNDNVPQNKVKEKLLNSNQGIVQTNKELFPTTKYIQNYKNYFEKNLYQTKTNMIKNVENIFKYSYTSNQIIQLVPIRNKFRKIIKDLQTQSNSKNIVERSDLSPSERSISSLHKICSEKCKPYVVYIPNSSLWSFDRNAIDYKRELQERSQKLSIPFIDGEKVINRNNIKDYGIKGPHLSESGYKKLSELIAEEIFN